MILKSVGTRQKRDKQGQITIALEHNYSLFHYIEIKTLTLSIDYNETATECSANNSVVDKLPFGLSVKAYKLATLKTVRLFSIYVPRSLGGY